MSVTKQLMGPIDFHSIFFLYYGVQQLFGYTYSLKCLLLCSAEERNSKRFGTTWGWV